MQGVLLQRGYSLSVAVMDNSFEHLKIENNELKSKLLSSWKEIQTLTAERAQYQSKERDLVIIAELNHKQAQIAQREKMYLAQNMQSNKELWTENRNGHISKWYGKYIAQWKLVKIFNVWQRVAKRNKMQRQWVAWKIVKECRSDLYRCWNRFRCGCYEMKLYKQRFFRIEERNRVKVQFDRRLKLELCRDRWSTWKRYVLRKKCCGRVEKIIIQKHKWSILQVTWKWWRKFIYKSKKLLLYQSKFTRQRKSTILNQWKMIINHHCRARRNLGIVYGRQQYKWLLEAFYKLRYTCRMVDMERSIVAVNSATSALWHEKRDWTQIRHIACVEVEHILETLRREHRLEMLASNMYSTRMNIQNVKLKYFAVWRNWCTAYRMQHDMAKNYYRIVLARKREYAWLAWKHWHAHLMSIRQYCFELYLERKDYSACKIFQCWKHLARKNAIRRTVLANLLQRRSSTTCQRVLLRWSECVKRKKWKNTLRIIKKQHEKELKAQHASNVELERGRSLFAHTFETKVKELLRKTALRSCQRFLTKCFRNQYREYFLFWKSQSAQFQMATTIAYTKYKNVLLKIMRTMFYAWKAKIELQQNIRHRLTKKLRFLAWNVVRLSFVKWRQDVVGSKNYSINIASEELLFKQWALNIHKRIRYRKSLSVPLTKMRYRLKSAGFTSWKKRIRQYEFEQEQATRAILHFNIILYRRYFWLLYKRRCYGRELCISMQTEAKLFACIRSAFQSMIMQHARTIKNAGFYAWKRALRILQLSFKQKLIVAQNFRKRHCAARAFHVLLHHKFMRTKCRRIIYSFSLRQEHRTFSSYFTIWHRNASSLHHECTTMELHELHESNISDQKGYLAQMHYTYSLKMLLVLQWTKWKKYFLSCKRAQYRFRLVRQQFERSRVLHVFCLWKSSVHKQYLKHKLVYRIIQIWRTVQSKLAFQRLIAHSLISSKQDISSYWKQQIHLLKLSSAIMMSNQRNNALLYRHFSQWKQYTTKTIHLKARLEMMKAMLIKRDKVYGINEWLNFALQRKKMRRLCCLFYDSKQKGQTKSSMFRWKQYRSHRKLARTKLAREIKKHLQSYFRDAWKFWLASCNLDKAAILRSLDRSKSNFATVFARTSKRKLCSYYMHQWSAAVALSGVHSSSKVVVYLRYLRKKKTQTMFDHWLDVLRHKRHLLFLLKRAFDNLQQSLKRQAWQKWLRVGVHCRHEKFHTIGIIALRSILTRKAKMRRAAMFHHWKSLAVTFGVQNIFGIALTNRLSRKGMQSCYLEWKQVWTNTNIGKTKLVYFGRRQRKRKVFYGWKHWTLSKRQLTKLFCKIITKGMHQSIYKAYYQWHRFSISCSMELKNIAALNALNAKYAAGADKKSHILARNVHWPLLNNAFLAWCGMVQTKFRHQLLCRRFRIRFHNHYLLNCWKTWLQLVCNRRNYSRIVSIFHAQHCRSTLKRTFKAITLFCSWVTIAKRTLRHCIAYKRRLCFQHSWQTWIRNIVVNAAPASVKKKFTNKLYALRCVQTKLTMRCAWNSWNGARLAMNHRMTIRIRNIQMSLLRKLLRALHQSKLLSYYHVWTKVASIRLNRKKSNACNLIPNPGTFYTTKNQGLNYQDIDDGTLSLRAPCLVSNTTQMDQVRTTTLNRVIWKYKARTLRKGWNQLKKKQSIDAFLYTPLHCSFYAWKVWYKNQYIVEQYKKSILKKILSRICFTEHDLMRTAWTRWPMSEVNSSCNKEILSYRVIVMLLEERHQLIQSCNTHRSRLCIQQAIMNWQRTNGISVDQTCIEDDSLTLAFSAWKQIYINSALALSTAQEIALQNSLKKKCPNNVK